MKKNVVQTYADNNVWKNIDYDWAYDSQCIDLFKDFCDKVLWYKTGKTGNANEAWDNKYNALNSYWERIPNNPSNKNQTPNVWDIIFWTGGKYKKYGHVGIVLKAKKWENKITVINQNTGNGDWKWSDDAVKIQEYSYKDVAGWYHYKKFIADFCWIPVFLKPQPADSATRRGAYIPKAYGWPYINIYPNFWNADKTTQYAILEHEYSHYIYFDVCPQEVRTKWEEMSNLPLTAQAKLLLRGKVYKNIYLNDHAKKSPSEDFAECWEDTFVNPNKEYWNYLDVKIDTAVAVMKKYDTRSV